MESIVKVKWADPIDYWLSANDNPFDNPFDKPYLNITYQYNKAREMVLDNGYDALFCVESDMIIPPDALQRLVACESDVAYGLYVFRDTKHHWSAYTEMEQKSGRSISENADDARAALGSVIDVAGVGLGCTLIKREVLTHIPFRLFEDAPTKTACDWCFALDCKDYGFTQRCDLGVVCGHQSYTPYPLILWPNIDDPKLYRRETLSGVEMKSIQPGQQFNVGMGETMLAGANA